MNRIIFKFQIEKKKEKDLYLEKIFQHEIGIQFIR